MSDDTNDYPLGVCPECGTDIKFVDIALDELADLRRLKVEMLEALEESLKWVPTSTARSRIEAAITKAKGLV